MEKKSKILVVLTRFPYPTDKGDKLRAYYQIRELSKKFDIHLLCVADEQVTSSGLDELKKFCSNVEFFHLSKIRTLFSLFTALFSRLPFQTHYFYHKKLKTRIAQLIDTEDVSLVYVQLVRSMLNIPFGKNTKYYLDYMDAFSLGMSKREKRTNYPFKLIVKLEKKRLETIEQAIAYHFHGTSIITKQDAKALEGHVPSVIDIVPNGIDNAFSRDENAIKKDIDVVFVGNMGYYPNIVASKVIVEEILPNLSAQIKTYLVGTNPSAEVLKLQQENVTVTGRVEEVQPYLDRSKIFVAPMYTGQGMQNKILEAMSMGLPVLTTPLAAEAFKELKNSGITVCEAVEEFTKTIESLLEDDELREELGRKSVKYIENYYRWDTATATLVKKFEKLIES